MVFEELVIMEEHEFFANEREIELSLFNSKKGDLDFIERGLIIIERQYKCRSGIIDILAKNENNDIVILEIKSTKYSESDSGTIGQIQGYIAAIKEEYPNKDVWGLIVGYIDNVVYSLEGSKYIIRFIDLHNRDFKNKIYSHYLKGLLYRVQSRIKDIKDDGSRYRNMVVCKEIRDRIKSFDIIIKTKTRTYIEEISAGFRKSKRGHRAEKGFLPDSTSKLLSNAEENFLQNLRIDGVEETKKHYKPSYYRTLKRRLINKYKSANTLVRHVEMCGILND